jgi:FADH2 O2-dependent halogenase
VVDGTGPRGFLHRALGLGERELPSLPRTQALFSHFSEVKRLGQGSAGRTTEAPPYPIDDAAVHHVFDGGWIWVLQFNNGVTSAGVAARDDVAAQLDLGEGAAAWNRVLKLIPALQEQFESATALRPFTHTPRLSFRTAMVAGEKWALLPSAAGFVDPLLSTGFPLTLLGVSRLAKIIGRDLGTSRFANSLKAYAEKTDAELMAASRLISALYANMNNFPVFVALSLLYFAAVSYSETARRLGKPELAESFLLQDHPVFGPASLQLCERAIDKHTTHSSEELRLDILRAIEPFNVAGLGDTARRNWYPVYAEDLLQSAHKLNATREDILQLVRRCGFTGISEATSLAPAHS